MSGLGPGAAHARDTKCQVTGQSARPPHLRAARPPSAPPGSGQGAWAGKCFWECGQWDWTEPTLWLCLGPGACVRAGDPTVAPRPTDTLTLLPAPSFLEMPWAFRGDTHRLAGQGARGPLSWSQGEGSPDMPESHSGRDGAHRHPAFSPSSSLVFFAFF